MIRQCPQCDEWFIAGRTDQVYDRDSCRSAAWKAGRRESTHVRRRKPSKGRAPAALWPTDNALEIPELDPTRQGDALDLPVAQWGSMSRAATMPGTWHFYTDDSRFSRLWDHPELVTATRCVSAVEVNYSTTDQMTTAEIIWQTYRKRYIARCWQAAGVRIFADLNVSAKAMQINTLGIPPGWRAFATRGYRDSIGNLDLEYQTAQAIAGENKPLFVVYGGGKMIGDLCRARSWIHLPDEIGARDHQVELAIWPTK